MEFLVGTGIFKTRGAGSEINGISKLIKEPVRQFVTSGSAGEEVPAKSVFVPVLVDALTSAVADSNADGYTTGSELGTFIQNSFLSYGEQTPQVGKINDYELSRGDFVFKHKDGPRKEKAALAPSTLRTTFPDWFFNPVADKGFAAASAAETEEAAIISAIFDLVLQREEARETEVMTLRRTVTDETPGWSDDLEALKMETYTHNFALGHGITSSGSTKSQSFKDGSSSFEKVHKLTFIIDDSIRMYKAISRAASQQPPEEFYQVTSRGASYKDFRRHLLQSGFDIQSETILIEGRRLQAVLLSWDPDDEAVSQ